MSSARGATRSRLRVVIADDHDLFRDGLRAILESNPAFTVVGDAGDGIATIEIVRKILPDVLLLDIEMPGPPVLSTLQRVLEMSPTVRVLVITMHRDQALVERLLSAGASEVLSKSIDSASLMQSISNARRNTSIGPSSKKAKSHQLLSGREQEVLHLVAEGFSNAQIANQLSIAVGTVKRHNSQIFSKLGAQSRTDALRRAKAMGEL